MNAAIDKRDETELETLIGLVSDEALEAAANTRKDTVSTLPGGISINVTCCTGLGD